MRWISWWRIIPVSSPKWGYSLSKWKCGTVLRIFNVEKKKHMCRRVEKTFSIFHVEGQKPNSVGVYMPIIRIPVLEGGMTISPVFQEFFDRPWHR